MVSKLSGSCMMTLITPFSLRHGHDEVLARERFGDQLDHAGRDLDLAEVDVSPCLCSSAFAFMICSGEA